MCGIAGFVGIDDRRLIEAMARSLSHRGPDAEGFYLAPGVGLASRRLSVIDLETGNQPIANENQTVWVVYNGEIYNCDELRERLIKRGHQFSTTTDTECIVHLYEDHGLDFVDHLRGMFGIALWDIVRQRLVLVRDRIGEKPLYYKVDEGRLLFGSECKAILQAVRNRHGRSAGGLRLPGDGLRAGAAHVLRGHLEAAAGSHAGVRKAAGRRAAVLDAFHTHRTAVVCGSRGRVGKPAHRNGPALPQERRRSRRVPERRDRFVGPRCADAAACRAPADLLGRIRRGRDRIQRALATRAVWRAIWAPIITSSFSAPGAQLDLLPTILWHYDEPQRRTDLSPGLPVVGVHKPQGEGGRLGDWRRRNLFRVPAVSRDRAARAVPPAAACAQKTGDRTADLDLAGIDARLAVRSPGPPVHFRG